MELLENYRSGKTKEEELEDEEIPDDEGGINRPHQIKIYKSPSFVSTKSGKENIVDIKKQLS